MSGSRYSCSDMQSEILLLIIDLMQEEIVEKDRQITALKKQHEDSMLLNESSSSENRAEDVKVLKDGLKRKNSLLKSVKGKVKAAKAVK